MFNSLKIGDNDMKKIMILAVMILRPFSSKRQDDYRFALLYASKRGLRGISEMRFPFLLQVEYEFRSPRSILT